MIMVFVYTDGKNNDFIMLCNMLDDYLNEIVGGEKQRKQYVQYNTLEDIHDVILIYDEKRPIACASFKHYEANAAEIKRVFVLERYRGKGLSKQLMCRLEDKAKTQGYFSLVLETGLPLVAAMGLYQRMGYKMIDNYGQYKDMQESICMQKDI
jgi:putative acetyltransferase